MEAKEEPSLIVQACNDALGQSGRHRSHLGGASPEVDRLWEPCDGEEPRQVLHTAEAAEWDRGPCGCASIKRWFELLRAQGPGCVIHSDSAARVGLEGLPCAEEGRTHLVKD